MQILKVPLNLTSIVQNFAGVLKSQSSRLVINTLEKNFKHCRAFHDMFNTLEADKYQTEFINMVGPLLSKNLPLKWK